MQEKLENKHFCILECSVDRRYSIAKLESKFLNEYSGFQFWRIDGSWILTQSIKSEQTFFTYARDP